MTTRSDDRELGEMLLEPVQVIFSITTKQWIRRWFGWLLYCCRLHGEREGGRGREREGGEGGRGKDIEKGEKVEVEGKRGVHQVWCAHSNETLTELSSPVSVVGLEKRLSECLNVISVLVLLSPNTCALQRPESSGSCV